MTNEPLESEPLSALAEKIARCANEADERMIEAANLVREARRRIEAGELGDVKWYAWARTNIKLSESRLRELQQIAEAEDPQKELKRLREKTRERVERHRKKKAAPLRNGGTVAKESTELDEDRKCLITWARTAPPGQVAEVLSYIARFDAVAESDSDEPVESAAAA